MKKSLVAVVMCATFTLPFAAFAQSTDAQYCAALSKEYRKLNASSTDTPEAVAVAQCASGKYAQAIPVLEKHLTANKVKLPPR